MRRYRIDSMKYEQRMNAGASGFDMSDWNNPYNASPPSSRGGDDDASSVNHSRPRRSRLDNDIPQPRRPILIQPARPVSQKSNRQGTGMSNGSRGLNSTFNGYDRTYSRYHQNSSRGPSEGFSGAPSARNASGYASDYANSRAGVGLLPNNHREPVRPRSTAAERYANASSMRNGFVYDSGESDKTSEELEEDEEEEEVRNFYMEGRAQGSRSVTNTLASEVYNSESESYYYGVVKLGSAIVDHVFRTMPPPEKYYKMPPIDRVAYVFYCAVNNKPYNNIDEFHVIFNREFYSYRGYGDSKDLALFKVCKRMQEEFSLKQLEADRLAYEKARQEAAESEKLDFNQHKIEEREEPKLNISQPEEVLSNGPLHYHSCLQFATIGVGGKLVIIKPAGTIDSITGHVLSTSSVHVDDLKTFLHFDEQSGKVIESVQNFKGPLIAGQTPTHSVRLYIQRQIDALRQIRNAGDVKKSEVVDALLVWQLLEIMVQQHGRVTGPDVATLLTNASEELGEKTGISSNGTSESGSKFEAKERFNKYLLGGHINEAVESAITDGLYADAMTLIRRLHPNDAKKIEEIEARFMNLRSIDDPFATLVAVSSDQPPPILTNSAFDDDNNWKRHAAIVLANLNSQTAMQTIYHLGLLLAKRERNCAADFCLLVVCILAGYDPFIPVAHDGDETSRKHIGLVHSGSNLLNRVDGLSGTAGFSFTDLHATDIFDYALRLGNNNVDSPLAKSIDYQLARIEYAKKLSSFGGFATDAFRYCTEVARSLWMYVAAFDKNAMFDLCDLAESLQYMAAATPDESGWITTMRGMLGAAPVQESQQHVPQPQPVENKSISSEAKKWHDEHQAPLEIGSRNDQQHNDKTVEKPIAPGRASLPPPTLVTESSSESTFTDKSDSSVTVAASASRTSTLTSSTLPPPPSLPKTIEKPISTPPPISKNVVPEMTPPAIVKPPMPTLSMPIPPVSTPIMVSPQPIPIPKPVDASIAKSPRSELDDLWDTSPPSNQTSYPPAPRNIQPSYSPAPNFANPTAPSVPTPPPAVSSAPVLQQATLGQASIPNAKTTAPPVPQKQPELALNERKASKGWFGSIKEKVIKSIPSANQMILPDDSKPSIVWDPVQKRYVGAGVEEEVVAAPPPVMSAPHLMGGGPDSNKSSTNSLRSARSGVGSRYLQSGMATSQAPAMDTGMPPMMPPTMPMSFSFMPAPTEDDSSEYVDPFSGEPTAPSESLSKQNND
ncbi:Protein transport protein sec-16A.1 [Caenorhabditis elegans]|uniref:Protein transport protein sec-16A.1 n=2 Tax=Caenorhabditis elegans TaxID=6239 RepID=SC161_CAEEL|nr:Protein transport protein sec-16A.1 [Caenorhabditis elegans]P34643.1 RecName: Full=Protein transport protein sec-16A.1; AltName: Full=Secretory cargo traffic protein sec-16A.1 [Caenorhabditis elegans]CAA80146.1 Protein transport protein sec-16A.1 [Caenorhabditis elegans]|eukprot:NP_499022.1 Protein transport protein Sec16 [Caenorhabditis elegans]